MLGAAADAKLFGTSVKLAAAARSPGVTTDITNALRAGTSICESNERTISKASTTWRFGTKATTIKRTLAGMCVNTMVLSSPMRLASRGAASCDMAEHSPDQKKNWPAEAIDISKQNVGTARGRAGR